MIIKEKVYLVWLHDTVVDVCASYERALTTVARTQGEFGGTWKRIANRWYQYQTGQEHERCVSRLEIEMREVSP